MTTPRGRKPSRKPKLPRWLLPELRPIVREAATRGGLARVEGMVFLAGGPGARVNAVHAIGSGALAECYANPWPAAVHAQGGSLLLIFERADDARRARAEMDAAIDAGQRLRLAVAPPAASA